MMNFDQVIQMLKEFDYKRNGKKSTIQFLIRMLYELYGLK